MPDLTTYILKCESQEKYVQFRTEPFEAHVFEWMVPPVVFITGFKVPVYIYFSVLPVAQDTLLEQSNRTEEYAQEMAAALYKVLPEPPYAADSWTINAWQILKEVIVNPRFKEIDGRLPKVASSLQERLYLLNKLPGVSTVHYPGDSNVILDQYGQFINLYNFEGARTEVFGMGICSAYTEYFGGTKDPLGNDSPADSDPNPANGSGRTVRQVLQAKFWDALWDMAPESWQSKKQELQEAVQVAMDIATICRYLGSLSYRDGRRKFDGTGRSLEYVRTLLLDR